MMNTDQQQESEHSPDTDVMDLSDLPIPTEPIVYASSPAPEPEAVAPAERSRGRFGRDPTRQAAKAEAKAQRKLEQEAANSRRIAEETVKKRRKQDDAAAKAFAASPPGRARAAFQAGNGFFQYSGALAETSRSASAVVVGTATSSGQRHKTQVHTDVLSQIEDEGWRLEDVGYVFEPTGSVSRDKFLSSGQTETINGRIVGIYLFRRAEERDNSELDGPELD